MKKYYKYIFIFLVIFLVLLFEVIIPNKGKKLSDNNVNISNNNDINDSSPAFAEAATEEEIALGDAISGTLFNSNKVAFSNSGFASKTVQDAIDELYAGVIGDCFVGYTKGTTTSTQYTCNKNAANTTPSTDYDGANVKYDNSNGVTANKVQEAIVELSGLVNYCGVHYNKSNATSSSYDCVLESHTVSYNCTTNGGTGSIDNKSVYYGNAVDLTPTCTKSGWTFVGWNTNSSATSAQSSITMGTSNVALYAIYRKEAITHTATFNPNSNTLSQPSGCTKNSSTGVVTCSCTRAAVYNNATQAANCTVTAPTITAHTNTPTICGYSGSSTGTTSCGTANSATVTLTADATYYAQTYTAAKTHTATFNPNSNTLSQPSGCTKNSTTGVVTCQCTRAATYNGGAQAANCTVTAPTITAHTNTPTICGYSGSSTGTTSCGTANSASVTLTADATYYAQTYKGSVTRTATFNPNSNTLNQPTGCTKNSSTGVVTCPCTIATVYNGASQGTSCNASTPTITAHTNTPTICGYTTSSTGASSCSVAHNSTVSISSNPTYYAQTYAAAKTHTATFNPNNNTLSQPTNCTKNSSTGVVTCSCTRVATYNGGAQAANCSVTAPTITAHANTPTICGYSGSSTGTTSCGTANSASVTLTANATYYAQTYKGSVTRYVKFFKNGNTSFTYSGTKYTADTQFTLCTIATVYNGASQGTSCSATITTPSIEAPSGFTVKGWHGSSGGTASPSYAASTSYSLTSSGTLNLYAQSQKAAITRTATFNPNSNTLSQPSGCSKNSSTGVVTCSCTIAAVYNGASQSTSCSASTPKITAHSNTPTVCGFTTSSSGTTSCSVAHNSSVTISSNPTYYAQTYKSSVSHTATFYPNNNTLSQPSGCSKNSSGVVTCSCTRATTYNGGAQASTCSITKPSITAHSNTPSICGFSGSSSGTTSCSTASGGSLSLSSSPTYYAQTYKGSVTRTVTHDSNGGSSISNSSCTIGTTYNGTAQGSSCSLTLGGTPTKSGCTFGGWKIDSTTYNAGASYTASANKTATAQWSCSSWHYVHAFDDVWVSTPYGSQLAQSGATLCNSQCQIFQQGNMGTTWSCTASTTTAPSSSGLQNGRYCWKYY